MCVCVFIKLHITAQSGPVILVIPCVCVFIKLHITAQFGPVTLVIICHTHCQWYLLCVCVVIPFILDIRFVDVPDGITQEEVHTGFFHLPSAVLTLIFLARRIQPFISLVDHEVEYCVLTT